MSWMHVLLVILSAAGIAYGVGHARLQKTPTNIVRWIENGRERLTEMLNRLEREPEPRFIMGAMCYEPCAPPERADYICAVCGERTIYGYVDAETVQYFLPTMRRLTEEMAGNGFFEASLEETYCSRCFPGEETVREVRLLLVYTEGDTVRTSVTIHDLQILKGFIAGELSYTNNHDARLPLREHGDRLQAILGIE